MSESRANFKVVIAGASVTGLTLANALRAAGIDYVVLEKRDVAVDVGQSILVLPSTSLVHEQLGVGQAMRDAAFPLTLREHWDGRGNRFCASDETVRLARQAGRPMLFVDRARYLGALYAGLGDDGPAKVRAREGVESVVETAAGVTVRTDRGNVVEGSILVGADGVHSGVRAQAARLLREAGDPAAADVLDAGFRTRYHILTCTSANHFAGEPTRQFLPDGVCHNSYHADGRVGGLNVAGMPGKCFWAIYIPLEEEVAYPSPRWTQEDIDKAMAKYGHLRVGADYTFNDLYASLLGGVMVSMEEGVMPTRWNSGGRTVLLGDAVHKATANLGMGGNLCVDDACRLANGLRALLHGGDDAQNNDDDAQKVAAAAAAAPSTAELVRLFDDYERRQRGRARFVRAASALFAGFETQSTWYAGLVKAVFAWIPAAVKMRVFALFDGGSARLDFLPVPVGRFE